MFGKAKCKLCDKEIRFAIRHLKNEHFDDFQKITKMNMPQIMKKYFIEQSVLTISNTIMEKVNQKCLNISIIKILLYFRPSSITIIPSARSNVI